MIKVLIVDDDPAVRAKALRCLAGPNVQLASAADGKLGLAQALELSPDLVICDVDMPGMDGFELLAALRESDTLHSTLVMMLTAQGSRDSMRLGMTLGADDYLTKPFTEAELRGAFDGLLKKRGRIEAVVGSAVKNQEDQLIGVYGRAFDGGVSGDRFPADPANVLTVASQNIIDATVLFSDIRGFTSIAEKLTAAEVARLLTEYFERICEPVLENRGHYLKMLGDGLMAVFIDDAGVRASPERRALDAALRMAAIAEDFAAWVETAFPDRGLARFQCGLGVHRGEVAISQMGSAADKVATPIGDTVNVAARLEGSSKELGWTIVASRAVTERAGDGIALDRSASLAVRGKEKPIDVVEVVGIMIADPLDSFAATVVMKRPEVATDRSQLQTDVRNNADMAARAVKEALGAKLDLLRQHSFSSGSEAPRLAGYSILQRIGTGGMSSIFLATREADGDLVVLKVLDAARDASEQMARFVREYALLSEIEHPNIVRIYHQGFSDKHAYIAMEYFENGDLRARMKGAFEPRVALVIATQVARALVRIHELGIVHRDIKPENLMVRADGSVVLADFGIAKSASADMASNPNLTQQGDMVGSPSYMSPEQIAGREVTPRSDLYALGVLLFEMLVGRRPYEGQTLIALLSLHSKAPPPELPKAVAQFQPVINRLMAKNPDDRYASANELLAELERLRMSGGHDGDRVLAV